ncbi:MAG: hypothetical protein ACFFCV_01965 [Promethearchaeota archaeon]
MPDEFDDIIDKIKEYFKLDSDRFDIDFLFIPESERNSYLKPESKRVKGFKISYHFETGMEKPEIRIEGDIDEKKIEEYLKNIDISQHPHLKKILESSNIEEIDASKLSLEAKELHKDLTIIEPHTEINDTKDYIEIILEVPGTSKEDVVLDFSEGGTKLIFNAENETRKYMKNIYVPFALSSKSYDIEVNNGIAIISIKK